MKKDCSLIEQLGILEKDTNNSVEKLSSEDITRGIKLEELELKRLDVSLKREELNSQEQDRKQRKDFSNKIFGLLIGFLSVTLLIVIASGIKPLCFKLSENLLITLLATTSADIIGIFILVVRYLFKATGGK
jgi:hypothetical protein